ncbi:MAG: S8 family serine peptidase [Candidatus Heimdallarchaeota archaeon]|nr:S8 family serine peptidase [Candidatus Heimdallarchaeota archaeon]
MVSKKTKIVVSFLTVFFLGLAIMQAQKGQAIPAQNVEMLDISIIFNDQVDHQFLNRIGAQMKYEFQTFPGVSIKLPSSALAAVKNNPFIKTWEYNQPVYLLEDSLDWGIDRIDAERVWGGSEDAVDVTTSVAGNNVKVAVIDTGIDYTHPDLAPIYAGGYDFVNGDDDPLDDHYHGTHCAGTVAAADDEPNALSGSLVGAAPQVSLYAVKVLDSQGSGTADGVAAGIDWAAANGMHVASLSLGASSPSSVIETAGQNAYAAGVLLVAASGNDGAAVGYPAAYPEFIAVGATDSSDNIASFSNYGPELEISAPGVSILSTTPTYLEGRGPFNPSPNYDTLSGTSMATPHVSGVAALVYSADLTQTNGDVRNVLTSTAEDLGASGWDQYFGYGLVDAEAAVAAVDGGSSGDTTPPAQVTGLTATAVSSSQIDLSWDANTESDLSYYKIYRDGNYIADSTTNSYSDTGLTAETTYTYEVSAVDTSGNEGQKSDSVSATTESSGSTTGTMYVSAIDMWVSRTRGPWKDISITVSVVDGNGNALGGVTVYLDLQLPDGSIVSYTGTTDSNGQVTFVYQKGSSGTYTATVTGLAKSGYTYDSSSNVETSETLNA